MKTTHMKAILRQEGFTLLEAIVAGGILAAALIGLSGIQALSLAKNVDSKELALVTNFGAEMIERIQSNRQRVLDYNGIDTAGGTPCPQSATTQAQALGDCQQWRATLLGSPLNTVRGVVVVTRIDPDPTTGVASVNRSNVTVTLSWNVLAKAATFGYAKTVTFQTVVAPE
ncbi:MAG TPA: hypothetical protein VH681_05040 [Nitrospiraceae bacterium]|jgi:Tfp pilus assembly protein PilV